VMAGFDQLAGKVAVKNRLCEEIDRDPATLETSTLLTAMVDDNVGPDVVPDAMKQRMVAGSAEKVAEQIKANVLDAGIDGVIINMPTSVQGYQPGVITALGNAMKAVLNG
jgi:hypothetical protein